MLSNHLPANPAQEAKNARGGGYHSEGTLLVIIFCNNWKNTQHKNRKL
jgi:hypothetical protein